MGKTPVLVGSHDGQLQGIPHPWASGIYTSLDSSIHRIVGDPLLAL